MTIAAQEIIRRVTDTLFDVTSVRWPVDRLCRYFNDGQRDIVTHRPDAKNVAISHALVLGHKQTLPANGEKLIRVLANSNGTKRAVTPVKADLLNAQVYNWRGMTPALEILHSMYDPVEPKSFDVYPPAAVGAALDIEYAARPTDIDVQPAGSLYTAVTGDMSVGDLFANALQDYILFRCHSENTQQAQPARAQAHYSAYANALGVELKATVSLAGVSEPNA